MGGKMPKRILLFTFGSRGDVQPLAALGAHLGKAAGHTVKVVSHSNNAGFIERMGISCAPVRFDFEAFLKSSPVLQRAMTTGDGNALSEAVVAKILETFDEEFRSIWELACEFQPHMIITNMLDYYLSHALGTVLQIPVSLASLSVQGMIALTSEVQTEIREPFAHKLVAYMELKLMEWLGFSKMAPKVRAVLGDALQAETPLFADDFACLVHEHMKPIAVNLVSASTLIVPKPTDLPPVFAKRTAFTGFWVVSQTQQHQLAAAGDPHWGGPGPGAGSVLDTISTFLHSGDGKSTVYIGWGSMLCKSPEFMAELAARSAMIAGLRAVVLGGWAGLRPELLPANDAELRAYADGHILFVPSAPHEWLFPQVAGIVHHGGAGTTAAALRAGVPSVVTPCLFDQFDNAAITEKCGSGIALPQLRRVRPRALAAAMTRCATDEELRGRAKAVGDSLQLEDGLANAADAVDAFISEDLDTGAWKARFDATVRQRKERSVGGLGFTWRVVYGKELWGPDIA